VNPCRRRNRAILDRLDGDETFDLKFFSPDSNSGNSFGFRIRSNRLPRSYRACFWCELVEISGDTIPLETLGSVAAVELWMSVVSTICRRHSLDQSGRVVLRTRTRSVKFAKLVLVSPMWQCGFWLLPCDYLADGFFACQKEYEHVLVSHTALRGTTGANVEG
jgi:hypothetical protein